MAVWLKCGSYLQLHCEPWLTVMTQGESDSAVQSYSTGQVAGMLWHLGHICHSQHNLTFLSALPRCDKNDCTSVIYHVLVISESIQMGRSGTTVVVQTQKAPEKQSRPNFCSNAAWHHMQFSNECRPIYASLVDNLVYLKTVIVKNKTVLSHIY